MRIRWLASLALRINMSIKCRNITPEGYKMFLKYINHLLSLAARELGLKTPAPRLLAMTGPLSILYHIFTFLSKVHNFLTFQG